jgi:hypothetical protein
MKRFLWILLIFSGFAMAQMSANAIRQSSDYYWGEGCSQNLQEAQDAALDELTKKISVKVSADFKSKVSEKNGKLTENVERVLKSQSAAILKNLQFIRSQERGKIHVFAYIHKDEVTKIFEERKKLAYELWKNAETQLKGELNLAQALKVNYFAQVLLRSIPDALVIVNGVNLTTKLPDQLNGITKKIKFAMENDEKLSERERRITMELSYGNKPVSLLDFSFWDGQNQVSVQARDGQAVFSLFGSSMAIKELDGVIKYNYYESRKEIQAVYDLWDIVVHPEYETYVPIKLEMPTKPVTQKIFGKKELSPGITLIIPQRFADVDIPFEKCSQSVELFQQAIQTPGSVAQIIHQDAFLQKKLADYLRYNRTGLPELSVKAAVRPTWHGHEMRRIPVTHFYPTINRQTTEYLVLDTDSSGQFNDFTTALNDFSYQQFVENDNDLAGYHQRQTIIKFVEKYRTAYMARNMTMISQIFADEALIIVGRTLKEKPNIPDMPQYQKLGNVQPDVEYLKFSKKEYLQRQESIFQGQSDILIEFSTFKIMKKHGVKNVYGVEMRQNYQSTGYQDEGYLFLLIDFNHQDPLIYVRAWQPQEWSSEQLINAANFLIY